MRNYICMLVVFILTYGIVNAQALRSNNNGKETSGSFKGTLVGYTSKEGSNKRKEMLIDIPSGLLVEFIYIIKTKTYGRLNPGEKPRITSQTMYDSLAYYILIDFHRKRFWQFDTTKKLLQVDTLENKPVGIFFEKFSSKATNELYDYLKDFSIDSKSDTIFFDKKYQLYKMSNAQKYKGSELLYYVLLPPEVDFPLAGENLFGKGVNGIFGGFKMKYNSMAPDEKIFDLEHILSKEDALLIKDLEKHLKPEEKSYKRDD